MAKGMSARDIAQAASNAGFKGTDLIQAVAIAYAESGGNPDAVGGPNSNGTKDYGLWQINSVHSQLLSQGNWRDPNDNAEMAYTVFKNAGNKFTPWTTYNNRAYVTQMSKARAGTAKVGNAEQFAGEEASSEGAAKPPGLAGTIQQAFAWITDGKLWLRIATFVAGAAILIVGLFLTFGSSTTVQGAAKSAIKFTAAGKAGKIAKGLL